MERELDPKIFGESSKIRSEFSDLQSSHRIDDIEAMVGQMAAHMKQLKSENSRLQSLINEQAKLSQVRFNKMVEKIKGLESKMSDMALGQNKSLRALRSEVKDQKLFDEKVRYMVERHNQIVQNFEAKFNALTKQLKEKDMKISVLKGALEESATRINR